VGEGGGGRGVWQPSLGFTDFIYKIKSYVAVSHAEMPIYRAGYGRGGEVSTKQETEWHHKIKNIKNNK
jgi:hypothetical protein